MKLLSHGLVTIIWVALLWVVGLPQLMADSDRRHDVDFGHDMLRKHFLVNYTNFNHGSFGACPRIVLEHQANLRQQQEQQPDTWMRVQYRQLLNLTKRQLADYVGLPPDQHDGLVLVESASTAVNSILRSYPWKSGDIMIYFSVAYGMVKNTAQWIAQQYQVSIIEVPVTFPISSEESAFIEPLQQALHSLSLSSNATPANLKMAIFDHMVSVPAVKAPIQQLANMIKQYNSNTFVLIDGAHVLGQLQSFNISAMSNMDAYLSNGHKWFYSPKGSAFLWVNAPAITETFPEPTVISSANNLLPGSSNRLAERYDYVSTRDYTGFLSISAALQFRQHVGGDAAIHNYCRHLALQAKHHLVQVWNVVAMAPDSMEEFMINIGLPTAINTTTMGLELHDWLLQQHNIYMLVLCDKTSNLYYTRLSSQIYLEFGDFVKLGHLVLEFIRFKQQQRHERLEGRENEVYYNT
jgi:selenocysteine lyase/cysteine desulfurase